MRIPRKCRKFMFRMVRYSSLIDAGKFDGLDLRTAEHFLMSIRWGHENVWLIWRIEWGVPAVHKRMPYNDGGYSSPNRNYGQDLRKSMSGLLVVNQPNFRPYRLAVLCNVDGWGSLNFQQSITIQNKCSHGRLKVWRHNNLATSWMKYLPNCGYRV